MILFLCIFVGIFLVGDVSATEISACGTYAGNDSYELIKNINTTGTCLTFSGGDVLLDCNNYRIAGNSYIHSFFGTNSIGIRTSGSYENLTYRNCIIENYTFGVGVAGDTNVIIDNFTIYGKGSSNNTDAILTDGDTVGLRVYNSDIYDQYYLISTTGLGRGHQQVFINNTFYSLNRYNDNNDNNVSFIFINNIFKNPTTQYSKNGLLFMDNINVIDSIFENNTLFDYGVSGVFMDLINVSNFTFSGNSFGNSSRYFKSSTLLSLNGGDSINISNNLIYMNDSHVINLFSSDSNLTNIAIDGNYVRLYGSANIYGIALGSDSGGGPRTVINSTLINNYIYSDFGADGSRHTMMMKNNVNGIAHNNTVIGGYYGVVFKNNIDTSFYDNFLYNSSYAVFLDKGSRNCLIYDNDFRANSESNFVLYIYSDTQSSPVIYGFNDTYKNLNLTKNVGFTGTTVFIGFNASDTNFVNVTYSQAETVNLYSNMTRKWYYHAYANDSQGDPVEGVNISIEDPDNGEVSYYLTGSSGYTELIELTSYFKNNTASYYKGNYSINASYPGQSTISVSYNVTLEENNLENIFYFSNLNVPSSTTDTETPTSSSSSGGLPTYTITQSNLQQGYSKVLGKNWKIKFNMNNETHELKIDDIQNNSARITISSNSVTFNLSIKQTKKIDLNENGFYDVFVLLKTITGNSYYPRAEVFIKSINEIIPENQSNETAEDNSPNQQENQQEKEIKEIISEAIKDHKFIYLIVGIILITILITLSVLKFKPKKKNEFRKVYKR